MTRGGGTADPSGTTTVTPRGHGHLSSVHIHLTKAFSNSERAVLASAVRSVVPDATVVFVWVNPHHALR